MAPLQHRPAQVFVPVLTILGLAIPVAMVFWLIHHYAMNVVYSDQWHDIALLGQAKSGHLSFSSVSAQYNENRIQIPNLLVLLLGYTTHFNIVDEEYLSGVMLVVATGFSYGHTSDVLLPHR